MYVALVYSNARSARGDTLNAYRNVRSRHAAGTYRQKMPFAGRSVQECVAAVAWCYSRCLKWRIATSYLMSMRGPVAVQRRNVTGASRRTATRTGIVIRVTVTRNVPRALEVSEMRNTGGCQPVATAKRHMPRLPSRNSTPAPSSREWWFATLEAPNAAVSQRWGARCACGVRKRAQQDSRCVDGVCVCMCDRWRCGVSACG